MNWTWDLIKSEIDWKRAPYEWVCTVYILYLLFIIIILSEAVWLQKHIVERSSRTCRTSECKNLIIKMF